MIARDAKFSDAMSSIDVNWRRFSCSMSSYISESTSSSVLRPGWVLIAMADMSGVTEGFGVDAAAAMRLMNLMMDAVPGEARFFFFGGGDATRVARRRGDGCRDARGRRLQALVDAFLVPPRWSEGGDGNFSAPRQLE